MTVQLASVLIATGVFPLAGAICVLLVTGLGQDRPSSAAIQPVEIDGISTSGRWRCDFAIANIGFVGGAVCGIALAILLARGTVPPSPVVRSPLWTWFSFSVPQSPVLTFGFEATGIKASLVGLTGCLSSIAVWNICVPSKKQPSDDLLLLVSLLYAAGTVFILAPNTAQALLGWGGISVLVTIMMRLSHQQQLSSRYASDNKSSHSTRPPRIEIDEGSLIPRLRALGAVAAFLERFFEIYIWQSITKTFPAWIGEQADALEGSSFSFQRMTTILWASTILLTWIWNS